MTSMEVLIPEVERVVLRKEVKISLLVTHGKLSAGPSQPASKYEIFVSKLRRSWHARANDPGNDNLLERDSGVNGSKPQKKQSVCVTTNEAIVIALALVMNSSHERTSFYGPRITRKEYEYEKESKNRSLFGIASASP